MFSKFGTPILGVIDGLGSRLEPIAEAQGWRIMSASEASLANPLNTLLLDVGDAEHVADLKQQFPHALIVSTTATATAEVDFHLRDFNRTGVEELLRHAEAFGRRNHKVYELVSDVAMRRQRMHQLNEISLALTSVTHQEDLLRTILSEARRIARCEAGSLFLVERGTEDGDHLVFKLTQNDAVEFPFVESRLPLTPESIAGYVAVTGKALNIKDVYDINPESPYRFNRSFDERMDYRTQSVLTIPMSDHRDRVVGVLQFLNKIDEHEGAVVPFDEETAEVLRAIASQAAVSIQKSTLIDDINQLFESFVQASVKTIEQRDPSTSGHSFRVAETTVSLLEALPASGVSRFRGLDFTPEHIREVRYAALLHDFGKIGVPEAVLVKANKLSDERLELIRYRIEIQKERLRRRAVEQELEFLHHDRVDVEVARRRVHRRLEKQISVLDQYYDWVVSANDPNVVDAGEYSHLDEIRHYEFRELDGTVGGVITDQDLLALSIRRGSLTPEERRQIQSHVVYTTEFLSVLPWPPELAGIPDIAGAHHERNDGSGYPNGLVGEQIPLASRVMAVCDVYDALTAMDRPYKPSMGSERAFDILRDEARRGLLDGDMVDIFIASGSHQIKAAV